MKQQESDAQTYTADKSSPQSSSNTEHAPQAINADDTQERAGKWAVMIIVAIGVFMATWTQLKEF